MATDTMVGIAGAVVLVAVMVGVFIYEYNNEVQPGGSGFPTDAENKTSFLAAYPGLNATDDIDGDNIQNYMDADMDDDGINNTEDEMTMYVNQLPFEDVGPGIPAASPATYTIAAAEGARSIEVTITVTPTQGATPWSVTVALVRDGSPVDSMSGSSGAITVSTDTVEKGSYTITVNQQQPAGQPVGVSGTATVMYA